MYILGIIEEGKWNGAEWWGFKSGQNKKDRIYASSWESNCVAFSGLIMKTINCFGLSQTAVPDDSLPGYWHSMDA